MENSQSSLVMNFGSFINRFKTLNYDFHMATTTTDAYKGKFSGGESETTYRRLRSWGALPKKPVAPFSCEVRTSGVTVMTRDTPNIWDVFLINATQSTCGSGDERAFASLEDVLSYPENSDFRRPDAFLAVIIVSDEDDFSSTSSTYLSNNYADPSLIPFSHYQQYLDQFAGAGNYSVNAISIMDQLCLNDLNSGANKEHRMGTRHLELARLTGGVQASICGDFSASLDLISESIVQLASSFKIDREPVLESFRVTVDDVIVPNTAVDGWTYEPTTMMVTFHGASIPHEGAAVSINYDPVKPK